MQCNCLSGNTRLTTLPHKYGHAEVPLHLSGVKSFVTTFLSHSCREDLIIFAWQDTNAKSRERGEEAKSCMQLLSGRGSSAKAMIPWIDQSEVMQWTRLTITSRNLWNKEMLLNWKNCTTFFRKKERSINQGEKLPVYLVQFSSFFQDAKSLRPGSTHITNRIRTLVKTHSISYMGPVYYSVLCHFVCLWNWPTWQDMNWWTRENQEGAEVREANKALL